MSIQFLFAVHCPSCGYTLDAAMDSGVDDEVRGPQRGDLTVCVECQAVLVFDTPPRLHAMTDLEAALLTESQKDDLAWVRHVLAMSKDTP